MKKNKKIETKTTVNSSSVKKDIGRQKKYDLFISYRRATGWHIARLIYERLTRKGLKVFLDIDELHGGDWAEALQSHVENCANVVVVLTPGDLDEREGDTTDWMRFEIAHAFKCGKNIIPLITEGFKMPSQKDLPKDIAKITTTECFKFSNSFFESSMEKIEAELKGVKIKKQNETFSRILNDYHQHENLKVEWNRLYNKQLIETDIDHKILDPICSKYPKLRVLAVGAHDGVRVVDRFGHRKNLEKLVMTESSKVSRPENIRRNGKLKKVKIYPFHMREDSYGDNLRTTLGPTGKKYNIGFACHTLLNCKRVLHIIKCMAEVMEPGGTIIIHDIDDGLNINYPDKNNYFARLNQIRFNLPTSGNRYTGRQIYGYLKMAGFENIKLANAVVDNSTLTHEQRWQLFNAEYGRVKYDLKLLSERGSEEAAGDYEWLTEHWDEIEMEYLSEDFFSCYGCMIWVATKKKE